MRSSTVAPLLTFIFLACGRPGADADTLPASETGEGSSSSGDSDDCGSTPSIPLGCDGVEFPDTAQPNREGIELFRGDGMTKLLLHESDSPVCGESCACPAIDMAITWDGVPAQGDSYAFNPAAGIPNTPDMWAELWGPPSTDTGAGTTCTYPLTSAEELHPDAHLDILSVGDTCIAGWITGLVGEQARFNGPFLAGSCQ